MMLPPSCFTVGEGQVMSSAWFPPDLALGSQAKEFNLGFIRPENLVSVMCLLLRSGFRLATLPIRPEWLSAAEMVVLLEGSPISTLWSSIRVTIWFLATSLTKALLP